MNRKAAREFVMQTVFQVEAQKAFSEKKVEDFIFPAMEKKLGDSEQYAKEALGKIFENIEAIDTKINEISTGWPVERLAKVDLAIIRVAIAEICYMDMAKAISINEAVELAKKYGQDNSSKFINGVLAKL